MHLALQLASLVKTAKNKVNLTHCFLYECLKIFACLRSVLSFVSLTLSFRPLVISLFGASLCNNSARLLSYLQMFSFLYWRPVFTPLKTLSNHQL